MKIVSEVKTMARVRCVTNGSAMHTVVKHNFAAVHTDVVLYYFNDNFIKRNLGLFDLTRLALGLHVMIDL